LEVLLQAIPDARVDSPKGAGETEILHLTPDSRGVTAGTLFVAIRGRQSDGHDFLPEAVARGAAAAVLEETAARPVTTRPFPIIRVKDSRMALAKLSERFYDYPSSRLGLIGVTGTNGKTTVTYLIRSILQAANHRAGLFGTVGYDLAGERLPATHTTPESHLLQQYLARLVEKGADYAVMEVSSHAVALKRIEGLEFDVAVFTNLTQDHLDYHQTMENYFESKRKLFSDLGRSAKKSRPKRAVINRDDPWGRRLIETTGAPVWTYGLEGPADLTAVDVHDGLEGLAFTAVTPAGSFPVRSALVGRFNIENLLAAVGTAIHLGISSDDIRRGIGSLSGVPGRFERFDSGRGFSIIVDYAHTEDALDRLLRAAAELTPGRVITVFGCGGDRDPGKRAPMGRAAARLSDVVVITSDNPRSEDPVRIIEEVTVGVREVSLNKKSPVEWMAVPDRRKAIERALNLAQPGDSVIVAGKGHEETQIIGERTIPFSDQRVAADWIQGHRSGGRVSET